MSTKIIMFCVFVFIPGTLFSLLMDGVWWGADQGSVLNALSGFSNVSMSGAGIWSFPVMLVSFFTVGVPRMLLWDYSYLNNPFGEVFKLFLYAISAGVMWGFFQVFIPVAQSAFSWVRSVLPF
jgi:hypothetical protein